MEDVLEAGHRLIDDGDLVDFTIFPAKMITLERRSSAYEKIIGEFLRFS